MTRRRWYPKPNPPSGAELWAKLQEEIPEHLDLNLPEGTALESFNGKDAQIQALKRRVHLVEHQRDAALALIQRSANLYLRYYRWRHALLLWWRDVCRG